MRLLELIGIDKIAINDLTEDIIQLIMMNNIGEFIENQIIFAREDRLNIALIALKNGIGIKEVAKVLSWKDFEYFASLILKEHNYQVYNSIRINRLEIDILAIDNIALAIDCKHWKYNNNSMLADAIKKQIRRINLLLDSKRFDIKHVVPIILTLHESLTFIDDVPIVPIDKFDNFLIEFKGYIDQLLII